MRRDRPEVWARPGEFVHTGPARAGAGERAESGFGGAAWDVRPGYRSIVMKQRRDGARDSVSRYASSFSCLCTAKCGPDSDHAAPAVSDVSLTTGRTVSQSVCTRFHYWINIPLASKKLRMRTRSQPSTSSRIGASTARALVLSRVRLAI